MNYEIKQVEKQKREVQLFLGILLNPPEVKEKNLFSERDKLEISIFPNIDLSNFNKIIIKNNVYSNNLANEQKNFDESKKEYEFKEAKKKVLEEEIQKLDGKIFSLKSIAEKQAV
ncbi:hypothetical protein [Listeria welshimeri]|uniref:hypothetical protein n=1 Tax=Listeria welshimeri TaxID=1643 RepID=UPI0018882CEC|nr:hypothetical protein [Listeria welshimeri]MBF2351223.1 hypothetical protein [Listeria welshimeri]